MDTFFIFGAEYLYIASLIIGLFFFIRFPEKRKIIIFGAISLVLTFIVAKILNQVITNPRPFVVGNFTPLIPHAPDNGFPSDHMLLVSAIPAIIIYYSRKYAVLLWIIAIAVGISRIYVGVHHPIDIEASASIAIIMTGISHYLLKRRKLI
jgi:undecaprenyl-diphosphatase